MIYMIENGFADPDREEAWNAWYSHHVRESFRDVPGWLTGQRFRALPPSHPKYRAMYTVADAAVMTSPEYKATTGGRFPADWLPSITHFHRNLFDKDQAPVVPMDHCLVVVESDNYPDVAFERWPVAGLDRSVPWRGIAVVPRTAGLALARRAGPNLGVYEPIFEQYQQDCRG